MGPGKRIKPTSITRAEEDALPAEERRAVGGPAAAGAGLCLAGMPSRPPALQGSASTPARWPTPSQQEGYDFAFAPAKATLYVDDFVQRQAARQ